MLTKEAKKRTLVAGLKRFIGANKISPNADLRALQGQLKKLKNKKSEAFGTLRHWGVNKEITRVKALIANRQANLLKASKDSKTTRGLVKGKLKNIMAPLAIGTTGVGVGAGLSTAAARKSDATS